MLVVVVDSATPAITAAVAEVSGDGVTVLAERVVLDDRAHAEQLAPGVEEVLAKVGRGPRDLVAVVAGVGPGPFTGLRVGLMTAASIADALDLPRYGVCSLDAIGAGTTGRVLVATDARRREIYWACYQDGRRITDPAVDRPADLNRPAGIDAAAGAGAHLYARVLGLPIRDEPRYPQAAALAALAADRVRSGAPSEPLIPLYLRRPDAVEPAARKTVS